MTATVTAPGDALHRRLSLYRRLFVPAAVAAGLGLAYAWTLWTPSSSASDGFRHIDVPPELTALWQANVSPVTAPPAIDVVAAFNQMSYLMFMAGLAAITAGVVLRRYRAARIAPLAIAVIGLVFTLGAHIDNIDGRTHARLEDATPARLTALLKAAALPSSSGAFGPLGDHFTGADLTRLDGLPSHTIEFKTLRGDGTGPGTLYVDGHPVSALPVASTATQMALAHYTAAQIAYLRTDPVTARRELQALSPHDLPLHTTAGWRISLMREWTAARGQPATMPNQDFPGAGTAGLDLQRLIARGLLLAAAPLVPASLGLGVLIVILRRRTARIDQLWEQISTPPRNKKAAPGGAAFQ